VTVPNYLIKAGDPEAVANAALIGLPRSPTVVLALPGFRSTTDGKYRRRLSVSNNSILRTEKLSGSPGPGQVTTMLQAPTTPPAEHGVELANTEYTNTTVTFIADLHHERQHGRGTGTTLYTHLHFGTNDAARKTYALARTDIRMATLSFVLACDHVLSTVGRTVLMNCNHAHNVASNGVPRETGALCRRERRGHRFNGFANRSPIP